jgi:hypothetical protein
MPSPAESGVLSFFFHPLGTGPPLTPMEHAVSGYVNVTSGRAPVSLAPCEWRAPGTPFSPAERLFKETHRSFGRT